MAIGELTSRQAVLEAIAACDRMGRDAFLRQYRFKRATKYVLLHEGKRYDPKAIAAVAYRNQFPERRPLTSDDFSQGPTVRAVLRHLGFEVQNVESPSSWHLKPGDTIRRKDLHARYGGNPQGGIAKSKSSPNILIFTDPSSGERHGYYDRMQDGILHYTGEGQRGDQLMIKGNKAILESQHSEYVLRVFEGAKGTVKYLGEYELDADQPFYRETTHESGGNQQRQVIMFRLRPRDEQEQKRYAQRITLSTPYRRVDETRVTQQRAPFEVDPDKVDRATNAHARLQNLLADTMRGRGHMVLRPGTLDVEFDVAWRGDGLVAVAEIKSLTPANETRQLRLGLGQILHYRHVISETEPHVDAVLFVEYEPTDAAWAALCKQVGVQLLWPESL